MVIRLLNPILLMLLFSLLIIAIGFVWHDFRQPPKKKKPNIKQPSQDAGIRELITKGDYDEAVTIYQKFTGVDAFSAKKAVDQIAREIRLSDGTKHKVEKLLKKDKAAAIEAYQKATGADLAEALDYVESL